MNLLLSLLTIANILLSFDFVLRWLCVTGFLTLKLFSLICKVITLNEFSKKRIQRGVAAKRDFSYNKPPVTTEMRITTTTNFSSVGRARPPRSQLKFAKVLVSTDALAGIAQVDLGRGFSLVSRSKNLSYKLAGFPNCDKAATE